MNSPIVAQKKPFSVEVEMNRTYYWCQCGKSKKQPFCDGSHKGTDFKPVLYKATKNKKIFFCGCKTTSNQPFCDGSHSKIKI